MTFLFGRRRSRSDVHSEQVTHRFGRSSTPSQSPMTYGDAPRSGTLHGLLRRRTDSVSSTKSPQNATSHGSPKFETNSDESPSRSRDSSRDSSRHRRSGQSTPRSAGNPEPPSTVLHGEPKQPGNIQDYLESRLEDATKQGCDATALDQGRSALTKNDYKAIFSGAPHFVLERGKQGRFYPQVIFPWDQHSPSIQRLLDRKLLSHSSFTLCTLHAHLPVPDDWAVKRGVPILMENWTWTGRTKRATFDIGVFEVPNMLASNGREPGTVGFRHFLELPIADTIRYTGPEKPRQAAGLQQLSSLPATEAFELMDTYNKPYSQCSSGAVFDRCQLLRDGPAAWKRIGVRDIDLQALVQRMSYLGEFRKQVLQDGPAMTILDLETPHELHTLLHGQFLYPRPPPADVMPNHPLSLKSQIKTLATVLATPGAWVDFSLPEWRLRAGQILWEAAPHSDGHCMNNCQSGSPKQPWINSGLERKWLLVQLLLAAELLIRLDAFVRKGMLHDPHAGLMTVNELHQFDKLREGKVNWDLIVVRRFFHALQITCSSQAGSSPVDAQQLTPPAKPVTKSHRFSIFESINRHRSNTEPTVTSGWDCQISSTRIDRQLEGLYVFAENINWPRIDILKATLEKKLGKGQNLRLPVINGSPCSTADKGPVAEEPLTGGTKVDMHSRSRSRRCLRLRSACKQDEDPQASDSLGWISRSLLSGFVIPGEGISHLLLGTLLENDPDAIEQLGPTANLYGGFVYEGRSWWSKVCIVGRVLSALEGSRTCMGWIGSNLVPIDATSLQGVQPGWFEVQTKELSSSRERHPRIKHGGKLTLESSPLGVGEIAAQSFTLPVDPHVDEPQTRVTVASLSFSIVSNGPRCMAISEEAFVSFTTEDSESPQPATTINFPLRYNVHFVSAHECRPPRGFTPQNRDQPVTDSASEEAEQHGGGELTRLSAHPLHQSFPYTIIPATSLSPDDAPPAASVPHTSPEIFVIDARGSCSKEALARAWCSSVGTHSVIGRVSRTCIACCVREARAIGVHVVIRVG